VRWELPAPLSVSYWAKRRGVATAEIFVERRGGTLIQRIAHAPLKGITREMLLWWMHHIGDTVDFEGQRVMAYRLWHPADHIHWSSDGPVRPGSRFHIVEAFQRERRFLIDQIFEVPKLDLTGFRLQTRVAGLARLSVDEDWSDGPDGVRWVNTMRLEAPAPLLAIAHRLQRERFAAWLPHNVEEVGFVPEFLPAIYRS
jgi:hypothetical protein